MNKPGKPDDPASLSLKPSRGTGAGADFSKVRGSASSGSAHGPPTADFSKVRSTVSSTEASAGGARSHTVQKGDTLSHLAKQYYGKASQWTRIFEANRDQLDDPDRIFPGQVLKIPDSPR